VKEHERIEEPLEESEERCRAVMEQSVEAIYLFDPDSKRVLETNHAFEELIGYTAEELLGMTIYDLVAHEREDTDTNVRRPVVEEGRFIFEHVYRREDGRLLEVEASATLIPYHGKEAVCVVARDVTERNRAQAALAEERDLLRALIDNIPDFIFVKDKESRFVINNAEHARPSAPQSKSSLASGTPTSFPGS
jgi:PAS domain S-box-containing protein